MYDAKKLIFVFTGRRKETVCKQTFQTAVQKAKKARMVQRQTQNFFYFRETGQIL
jgi:6-phosphogluconolactonase/glucosamine-6-phosphate isomerase/deaminase